MTVTRSRGKNQVRSAASWSRRRSREFAADDVGFCWCTGKQPRVFCRGPDDVSRELDRYKKSKKDTESASGGWRKTDIDMAGIDELYRMLERRLDVQGLELER